MQLRHVHLFLPDGGARVKQFTTDFIRHMTVALPAKLDRLDEQARSIKKNYVTMALFIECVGDPQLRAMAWDLVIQDRLIDSHPEEIAATLPRLVDEAREMLRHNREIELSNRSVGEAHR
jgi:hypothetical protein